MILRKKMAVQKSIHFFTPAFRKSLILQALYRPESSVWLWLKQQEREGGGGCHVVRGACEGRE